jgi:hypothetical protein
LESLRKVDKALGARFGGGSEGVSKAILSRNAAAAALARRAKDKVGLIQGDADLSSADVAASVIEGFRAQGMSEKEAVNTFSSMSVDERRAYVGSLYGDAKLMGGSYSAGIFRKSEELAGGAGLSGEALEKALAAKSAQYEAAIGWGGESDEGAQELRSKMKGLDPMAYLAMVAGSGLASPEQVKEIHKKFMEVTGGKGDLTQFTKLGTEYAGKYLTQKGRDALKMQVGALSVDEIIGEVQYKRSESETLLSKEGLAAVGKAAGVTGLEAFAGAQTPEGIIESIGALGLERLRKEGGHKDIVSLIDRFKAERDPNKKEQLGNQLSAAFARRGTGAAGSRTESLVGATGKGAAQAEAGAASLDDLAATLEGAGFKAFNKGAFDLLEGATQLRKAMETETMKQLIKAHEDSQ